MITVETNTQTEQEIRDAFTAHGLEPHVVEEPTEAPAEEPKEETTDSSEPEGKPGGKAPAEPEGKSAAIPEVVEETQETPPQETQEPSKPKAKGGYQARIEKQTKRIETLQDELDAERGDKTRLREQLEEAQARLSELRGSAPAAEAPKETGPVRPKRPTMPDLADYDFDQDKYQAAMKQHRIDFDKYEVDLDAYNDGKLQRAIEDSNKERDRKAKEASEESARQNFLKDFVTRKDKDAAEIGDDFNELLENEPEWSEAMRLYIMNSDHPGHLMKFLYDNPGEIEKIEAMRDHLGNPNYIRQSAAIARIEDKLPTGSGKKAAPPKGEAPAPTETKKEEPPPAKQTKKAETPEPPITTLGSRTISGVPKDYRTLQADAAQRGDSKEFQRLRAEEAALKRR